MKIQKKILCVTLFFLIPFFLPHLTLAQIPEKKLTLDETVTLARDNSTDAVGAKHLYMSNYWQHQSFKAGFLPQLSIDASIPNLNRSISPITMPDGSDVFISRSLANSSANLSLSQAVGLTGGRVFINSGIQRIDLIRDSITTSFSTTPVSIGISQPLFGFNSYKWEKQIEPLRYEEGKRQYIEEQENIAMRATRHFFNLLNAQINKEISKTNYSNNDTLFKIAKSRYDLGKIAENELLEMELNYLNSQAGLEQAKIDYQSAMLRFKSYLGLAETDDIELILPLEIPDFKIDVSKAVAEALKNSPNTLSNKKSIIEAERDLAKAKAGNRFNVNLFAIYGLAQSAYAFSDVYKNPLDQQQLEIGIQVPILDWGISKGKVKMAKSYSEFVKAIVNQDITDFEQEVFLKVLHFNILFNQIEISGKADIVAQKRYEATKQRFIIGNIDIIPLNLAEEAKDLAKQNYISSLRKFWEAYYEIRKLTHYDFQNNKEISLDFDNF